MRKFAILITFFSLAFQAANAQTQKGNQNLGLSLGFYSNSGTYSYQIVDASQLGLVNSSSTGFSTTPNYSYFIANNLDLGVGIGFGSQKYNNTDATTNALATQVNKNYYGSVYLRKYLLYNNKVGIRTGPYLSYQYTNSSTAYTPDNNQVSNNYNGHYFQAGLNADFVYYPATKIGLAVNLANLSYSHNKYGNQQQNTNSNQFNLQFLNNNLMLSAFYVFGH